MNPKCRARLFERMRFLTASPSPVNLAAQKPQAASEEVRTMILQSSA
jgi:hypothetical protein